MKLSHITRIVVVIAVCVAATLAVSEPALAQCAMCRGSLGTNSSFIRNFNLGVLVLLVPPVTMFCAIFVIAYRHRKS